MDFIFFYQKKYLLLLVIKMFLTDRNKTKSLTLLFLNDYYILCNKWLTINNVNELSAVTELSQLLKKIHKIW